MFKRYDGFINATIQEGINGKLPICPFCGELACWTIEVKSGLSKITSEFQCEHCGAKLLQENFGAFSLDVLTVTSTGLKNYLNLELNGSYQILILAAEADNLRSKVDSREQNLKEICLEKVVDDDYKENELKSNVRQAEQNNRAENFFNEAGSVGKVLNENTEINNSTVSSEPVKTTDKRDNNLKDIFLAVVIIASVFLAILIIYYGFINQSGETVTDGLSYNNYMKIKNGMSYEEVTEIFGDEGELTSSAGYGDYSLKYYTWQNFSGSKIVVVGFENNKVIAKSQIGLT